MSATPEVVLFSSFLKKKQEKTNVLSTDQAWKKRFFVLRSTRLAYYLNEQEYELRNIIYLETIHGVAPIKDPKFGVVTTDRTYYLEAPSGELMHQWIDMINQAIALLPNNIRQSSFSVLAPMIEAVEIVEPLKPASIQGSIITSTSFLTTESVGPASPASSSHNPTSQSLPASPEGVFSTTDSSDDEEIPQEQLNEVVIKQGYIERIKTGYQTTFKSYWCVLRSSIFVLYKTDKVLMHNQEYEVRYIVPLSSIISVHSIESPSKKRESCFKIVYGKHTLVLTTTTEACLEWVEILKANAQKQTRIRSDA